MLLYSRRSGAEESHVSRRRNEPDVETTTSAHPRRAEGNAQDTLKEERMEPKRMMTRKERSFVEQQDVSFRKMSAKKERSFYRHSFHQNSSHFTPIQNGYRSFDQRLPSPLITRERSFVNPRILSTAVLQVKEQHTNRRGGGPGSGASSTSRNKPSMELYRPPNASVPDQTNSSYGGGAYNYRWNTKPGLNINAREFAIHDKVPHSKSSGTIVGSGQIRGRQAKNDETPKQNSEQKVHFSENKENLKEKSEKTAMAAPSTTIGISIKRSKSLGSADMRTIYSIELPSSGATVGDLGIFPSEVERLLNKTLADTNKVNCRQLMESVRYIFTRVLEASRHAEAAARLCITIIEKESGETFMETLLNTCQEYFQERDSLLRTTSQPPHPGLAPSYPKWIAYMSFLNEMYTQLKRRHMQLMTRKMKNNGTAPGLLLLTLLVQCCSICLKETGVNSLPETECLFFILTAIGKDIETEMPHQMARIMATARDAFMNTVKMPAVMKTLLQLIEMHAAHWQLPASAVMYYYPSSGAK